MLREVSDRGRTKKPGFRVFKPTGTSDEKLDIVDSIFSFMIKAEPS